MMFLANAKDQRTCKELYTGSLLPEYLGTEPLQFCLQVLDFACLFIQGKNGKKRRKKIAERFTYRHLYSCQKARQKTEFNYTKSSA